MSFYNIDRPIHRIFAIFSGLVGIVFLLPALAAILERQSVRTAVFLVSSFVSILFIVSSVALFRSKNWGRLLLSFLLHGLIIGYTTFMALLIIDFSKEKEFLAPLGGLGIFLIPILTFIVLIVILHSKHLKEEVLHKKPDLIKTKAP
ncbi:hypothetical protein KAR91_45575 [Candidatus Pacearchaeota archaeon]|nr:hypothetical protein [Candidatus Pacearchaeota archaeon]